MRSENFEIPQELVIIFNSSEESKLKDVQWTVLFT